jgi:hypothetical protein
MPDQEQVPYSQSPRSSDAELLESLDLNERAQPVEQVPAPPTDREAGTVAEPREARPEGDRLAAALRAVEEQQRRIQDLEGRIASLPQRYEAPARDARPEAQVEFEEVLPGRRIPKDPQQRPIKIDTNDLLRLGWNEDPAKAINALANAFFGFIVDAIPQYTMQQYDARIGIAQQAWQRKQYFWSEYPDLTEHETFVSMLEQEAQRAGYLTPNGKTQEVYNREVAGLARQRIAAMRGITVDQYMASVPRGQSPAPPPQRSRAVTASGGRGAPRQQPSGPDRYLDDL